MAEINLHPDDKVMSGLEVVKGGGSFVVGLLIFEVMFYAMYLERGGDSRPPVRNPHGPDDGGDCLPVRDALPGVGEDGHERGNDGPQDTSLREEEGEGHPRSTRENHPGTHVQGDQCATWTRTATVGSPSMR